MEEDEKYEDEKEEDDDETTNEEGFKSDLVKRIDKLVTAYNTDPNLRAQFFFSAGYWEGMEFGVRKVTSKIIDALRYEYNLDQEILDRCKGAQNRLLFDYRLI